MMWGWSWEGLSEERVGFSNEEVDSQVRLTVSGGRDRR